MQEKETISLEVEHLLKKGAVKKVCPQKDKFLSNIFKMGEETCDQLEGVKAIYSYTTFQNGEFTVAENSLAKNEYICKLDLKDVSHFLRTIKRE